MENEEQPMEEDSEKCVLCFQVDDSSKVITLGTKGLKTVKEYSQLRKDKTVYDVLNQCTSPKLVHKKCRKEYTNRKRVHTPFRYDEGNDGIWLPSESKKPRLACLALRSQTPLFVWQEHCFLCAKEVKHDTKNPNRSKFSYCSNVEFRDAILDMCHVRNDTWSIEIECRLQSCDDIVAAGGVYHTACYDALRLGVHKSDTNCKRSPGRPESPKCEVFALLCQWLEAQLDDNVFTISELQEQMRKLAKSALDNDPYSTKWLSSKLEQHFGDHVFFAKKTGKETIVCLRDMAGFLIRGIKAGFEEPDQRARVIKSAAGIIKREIDNMQHSNDTYPSLQDIDNLEIGKNILPESLQLFLTSLVPSTLKQVSIGQCLVGAVRPSVILPIPFGIGVEMDHTFGSKWLVSELSRLGFSISYDEVARFKQSVIQADDVKAVINDNFPGSFTQWVADNVDHNIATLNGQGTFHGMGIISVTTPAHSSDHSMTRSRPVPRMPRLPVKMSVKNKGVPLIPYVPTKSTSEFKLKSIIKLKHPYVLPHSLTMDLVWQAGYLVARKMTPNWSGFMQDVTVDQQHPPKAEINFLPIIDLESSNETCIYSTLLFIQSQASALNIPTPCITFDQPLWMKAVDIVRREKMQVVCRLGGFHMLMSFLGSIGSLMGGSGLSQLLQCCYGTNTVVHMMSGKAVARALRGHLLTSSALFITLINIIRKNPISEERDDTEDGALNLTEEDIRNVNNVYDDVVKKKVDDIANEDEAAVLKLEEVLGHFKDRLAAESRTSKLWIRYISYVEIVRNFIRAERMGNWHLHLVSVGDMLNLFAAVGHNNYAKSARLYLQMMTDLPTTHPWLAYQFQEKGYHTIRRSNRFWAGLWPDLVIEQALMRTLKTRGGLTRGRGMSESVRTTWTNSMHRCAEVHKSMASITKLDYVTSDQHIDMGEARRKKDSEDLENMGRWLSAHNPFTQGRGLTSIATGGVAPDNTKRPINCDESEEVGRKIQESMDNSEFREVKLKRVNQVRTLIDLEKGVQLGDQVIHIDAGVLFARLSVLAERSQDTESCFAFELAPYPASLFYQGYMRKPDKAKLAKALLSSPSPIPITPVHGMKYVLDGGALLHRVRWQRNVAFEDICDQYINHIRDNYGEDCMVVFDGYNNGASTKDHEHNRRSKNGSTSAVTTIFESTTIFTSSQQCFLANSKNKQLFIQLLTGYLTSNGHQVHQAREDADTVIVAKTLHLASVGQVMVVADDADVIILLLHHCKHHLSKIFLQSDVKQQVYDIQEEQDRLGRQSCESLLFVHAWGGCDTVSSLFNKGKEYILKRIASCRVTREVFHIFNNESATQSEIAEAGIRLLVYIFGGKGDDTLNKLRFLRYMKLLSTTTTRVKPEMLPPTERAAYFHCLRIHLQVIQWKTLMAYHIEPTEWGWQLDGEYLAPIETDLEAAPEDLLKVVRCKCKSSSRNQCGTSTNCSCRKHGLACVSACGDCHGIDCCNAGSPISTQDITDIADTS